jgi:hypothetical protein
MQPLEGIEIRDSRSISLQGLGAEATTLLGFVERVQGVDRVDRTQGWAVHSICLEACSNGTTIAHAVISAES